MRFAVDTGGTFTDLVVEEESGLLRMFKSSTTPDDPVRGVLDVLQVAADTYGVDRGWLLGRGTLFIHATTRAINAILMGATARTAFLSTEGHPDVLLFREGGRTEPFNFTRPYPDPYVPRSLTWEVPERIGAGGEVVSPLDEERFAVICSEMREKSVEAVAVCLLWSIVNPVHELRVGELLEAQLPGVSYTLSHRLNPAIREYRRASSAAIDASLKPVMSAYLESLVGRLEDAGFGGRVLVVASSGGVLDAESVAAAPIHTVGSGPAMAPVAGRYYARVDADAETAIVADTGGTSYDVSLVRRGRIPWTRETWLGPPYFGHMTGFPSVDVKSVGAGGGSIAWVDEGGLLHVGPESAGAVPGPACYGRGGTRATVTDACLALGYIDPGYFMGGTMELDVDAAKHAIRFSVGEPLDLVTEEAALAIVRLATEHMVRAIEEITLNQGIDPRKAVLIGGGGAAGLNAVAIARRLGCRQLVIPAAGAVLSAAGATMSELSSEFAATLRTTTSSFDFAGANETLARLEALCEEFAQGPGAESEATAFEFGVEARYPHQIWELDVPLRSARLTSAEDVEQLRQDFHAAHEDVFAISDPGSQVEVVSWRARVRCRLHATDVVRVALPTRGGQPPSTRRAYFADSGFLDTAIVDFADLEAGASVAGPAIVESPMTTVVVDPEAIARRAESGSVVIDLVESSGGS